MLAIGTLDKNTMQYQMSSRPFTAAVDMSGVKMTEVSKALRATKEHAGKKRSEISALEFYYLNHAVAELSKRKASTTPLTEGEGKMMEYYHHHGEKEAARMFAYLMFICFRESRHTKDLSEFNYKEKGRTAALAAVKNIGGSGSSTPPERMMDWGSYYSGEVTLGDITYVMHDLFSNGSYSGGYGGKAWAEVCEPLMRFVHGDISAEIMMDTAFTLAHNNGPIFNKGMLFHSYDKYELVKILDVQRAGMIPELIKDGYSPYINDGVKKVRQATEGFLGNIGGDYVDWYVVEALGAMQSYPDLKKQQVKEHGMSLAASNMEKIKEEAEAKKQAAFLAQKEKEAAAIAKELEGYFQITDSEKVKKIEMDRSEA